MCPLKDPTKRREYKVQWAKLDREKYPEKYIEKSRKYYLQNKEKINIRTTEYRKRVRHTQHHKDYRRKEWMRNKYGLTPERYNEMHRSQHGLCAICGNEEITRWRRLAVDHDHKTGEIRGLLCFKCNMMLAYFEDGNWCKSAAEYLNGKKGV